MKKRQLPCFGDGCHSSPFVCLPAFSLVMYRSNSTGRRIKIVEALPVYNFRLFFKLFFTSKIYHHEIVNQTIRR